jgi:CheY-like chemotaxis protein
MTNAAPRQSRKRVLLVSDDDAFSTRLKPCLPAVDVLSLTESSVWVANRAGIDVTRGIDAVLLDNHITGRLQLRLYETLRPSDRTAQVPVIFTRSKLTTDSAGFTHALDVYQPESAGPYETAQLVADVLGTSASAPRPGQRTRNGNSMRGPATGTRGPNLFQRLGLWGVAASLLAFTFWPLVGSGPVREVVSVPLQALADGPALLAEDASATH